MGFDNSSMASKGDVARQMFNTCGHYKGKLAAIRVVRQSYVTLTTQLQLQMAKVNNYSQIITGEAIKKVLEVTVQIWQNPLHPKFSEQ